VSGNEREGRFRAEGVSFKKSRAKSACISKQPSYQATQLTFFQAAPSSLRVAPSALANPPAFHFGLRQLLQSLSRSELSLCCLFSIVHGKKNNCSLQKRP
jgi:hypothetical protein